MSRKHMRSYYFLFFIDVRLIRTWSFEFVLPVTTKRKRNMKRRKLVKMEKLFWSAETKFSAHGASLGQRPRLLHLWVSKISLSSKPLLTLTSDSERYFWHVWVELIFLVSFQRTLKCQRRKLRACIALQGLGWPRPNESTTRHLQRSSVTHSSRLCQPPPNTWRHASEFSEDANLWLGC